MSKFQILKNTLAVLVVGSLAQVARADGFVCDATHESLRIQVYNRTQASEGTRNVAVMVLSDPSKPRGQRTLLRFEADNDGLTNDGARYTATLLPRISPLLDQQVQGIQLGNLHEVALKIDFSYRYPVGNDDLVAGVLELTQNNGDQLWVDLDCTRYLKGSK
jgi:hypothetical protein